MWLMIVELEIYGSHQVVSSISHIVDEIYLGVIFAGAQYAWLTQDLASVDRLVTPWLVAAFHPPWYNSYSSHYREVECMRLEMEDILYQNGVNIVFSGHVSFIPSIVALC